MVKHSLSSSSSPRTRDHYVGLSRFSGRKTHQPPLKTDRPAGQPQNSGLNQPNCFPTNPSPYRPKLFLAPTSTVVVTRAFFSVPENVCASQNLLGLRSCPRSSDWNAVPNQTFLLHVYTKHARMRARLTVYFLGCSSSARNVIKSKKQKFIFARKKSIRKQVKPRKI